MRKLRAVFLVSLAVASVSVLVPAVAFATEDHFCNILLQPGQVCGNGVDSDWDRVRSRYPGQQSDGVTAGVYMYSYSLAQYRDGIVYTAATWSSPTWNPMGHNYGVTTYRGWRSYNVLPGQYAHTLVGWTSDNQTDG